MKNSHTVFGHTLTVDPSDGVTMMNSSDDLRLPYIHTTVP